MERVGEHPVSVGPLAVRWLAYRLPELRAGTTGIARLRLQNAGSATWWARGDTGVLASYHGLDDHGNPIVWDGVRTPLELGRFARRDRPLERCPHPVPDDRIAGVVEPVVGELDAALAA